MEEHTYNPTQINGIDMNKVLHTSLSDMNKKRKFHSEQLGMPLPKHMCLYHNYAVCSSPSSGIEAEESLACMIKGESDGRDRDDVLEPESEKESNSFNGDAESVMSSQAKIDPGCLKSCSSDQASTSSFNWSGNWSKNALYSSESRSITKSTPDRLEQQPIGREPDILHDGSGWNATLNYEHLLEFGNHGDCTCAECNTKGIELSAEKELENLLYSNGSTPDSYVLSSGRWTVNQDARPGSEKLTIDREFEEYFSMLLL